MAVLRPAGDERGPLRISPRAWTWLALVGALLGLGLGGTLARWIAFALLLAIAPQLLAPFRHLPLLVDNRERIARWLPLLVVGVLAASLLGDMMLGRPPVSRDHGIHFFQTRILVDELLPSGHIIGRSDSLNTGYPFGDSYPVLGYLMTGALNLLSFGLISLRHSYAWGLLGVWLLALWGVWWLAATIARELQGESDELEGAPAGQTQLIDPRWAGALAAIAWLIDPGSSREGGWNYLMFHGVWPQLLSSALWIASLPATWAALRRPSLRSLSLAAMLLGGSVLAHPFGMLTAATSAVAWPIVTWASGAMRRLPGGQIRWWLLIHVFAGLASIGVVVTFLASAGEMSRSPVPWKPLGALATELLTGELFRDHRAWIGPLTLIGMVIAIRRGRTMAWLAIGLACAMLVLGSEASISILRLDLLVSGFKNLQFPRYAIALKPILYAFAGIAGASLLARLRELPGRDHPTSSSGPLRPGTARLLACICLAPLVASIVDDRDRLFPRPVGGVEVLEGSPHAAVDAALLETLRDESQSLAGEPEPRKLKVAFLRPGMGGATFALFAITDADGHLVMDGHIPAVNYKYQVRRRSVAALQLMGVTHVIWDHPLVRGSDDKQLGEALEVVGQFGVWTLGRLPAPQADDPIRRGFIAGGKINPDDVSVTRESATEWRIEVAAGSGRVQVPVGPYRKWTATHDDGSPAEFEPYAMLHGVPGLQVNFAGPGAVTLRYQRPPIEDISLWVSFATWLLLLAALGSKRERELAVRLQSERTTRISWALGIVTLAVVLVGGYVQQERKLAHTWQRVLDDHRSSAQLAKGRKLTMRVDLVDRGLYKVRRSTTDGCDGTLGKDAMAGCTQSEARPRKSMVFRPPYLYRCLYVKVAARGSVDIELEGLREDDDLAGFIARAHGPIKQISILLPGDPVPFEPSPQQKREHFHVSAEARGDANTIEVRNLGPQDMSMCFALIAATEE